MVGASAACRRPPTGLVDSLAGRSLARNRDQTPGRPHARADRFDWFVDAVHTAPNAAESALARDRTLAHGASSWGETGLQAASHLGNRRLLRRLVAAGAELDVFASCTLGDLTAIAAMLAGIPRDACGVHDLPLTHFAVMSRDVAVLQLVLDAGIDVNPARASLSPLHSAVAIGSDGMVAVLLAAGADLDFPDGFGRTYRDWALLLDAGYGTLHHAGDSAAADGAVEEPRQA